MRRALLTPRQQYHSARGCRHYRVHEHLQHPKTPAPPAARPRRRGPWRAAQPRLVEKMPPYAADNGVPDGDARRASAAAWAGTPPKMREHLRQSPPREDHTKDAPATAAPGPGPEGAHSPPLRAAEDTSSAPARTAGHQQAIRASRPSSRGKEPSGRAPPRRCVHCTRFPAKAARPRRGEGPREPPPGRPSLPDVVHGSPTIALSSASGSGGQHTSTYLCHPHQGRHPHPEHRPGPAAMAPHSGDVPCQGRRQSRAERLKATPPRALLPFSRRRAVTAARSPPGNLGKPHRRSPPVRPQNQPMAPAQTTRFTTLQLPQRLQQDAPVQKFETAYAVRRGGMRLSVRRAAKRSAGRSGSKDRHREASSSRYVMLSGKTAPPPPGQYHAAAAAPQGFPAQRQASAPSPGSAPAQGKSPKVGGACMTVRNTVVHMTKGTKAIQFVPRSSCRRSCRSPRRRGHCRQQERPQPGAQHR